jgi:hypothetical protein
MTKTIYLFLPIRRAKRGQTKKAPSVAFKINEGTGALPGKARRYRSPAESDKLLTLIEGCRRSDSFIKSENQLDRRLIDYRVTMKEYRSSRPCHG